MDSALIENEGIFNSKENRHISFLCKNIKQKNISILLHGENSSMERVNFSLLSCDQ
jgi:hypothetical protein